MQRQLLVSVEFFGRQSLNIQFSVHENTVNKLCLLIPRKKAHGFVIVD